MPTDIVSRIQGTFVDIENASSVVANVSMMLMMVLITFGAFSRYVLNAPIVGANQFTELYLMPLLVFGTVALLRREGGNINVDLIRGRFTEGGDTIVSLLTNLGLLVVFVPIGYLTYGQAVSRLLQGATVSAGTGLQFPTGFSWLIVFIGVALFCVRIVLDTGRDLVVVGTKLRESLRHRGMLPSEQEE